MIELETADLMPNAELVMIESQDDLVASIPSLAARVGGFLAGERVP